MTNIDPYQRIFAIAMSVFYALVTLIGLFNLPAIFSTYGLSIADALGGFCFLMLALYALTLLAIFWQY